MLNILVMRAKISKTAEKKKFFSFFFIGEGVRLLTSLFSWGSFVAGLFFWAFLRGGCPAVFFGGVVGGVGAARWRAGRGCPSAGGSGPSCGGRVGGRPSAGGRAALKSRRPASPFPESRRPASPSPQSRRRASPSPGSRLPAAPTLPPVYTPKTARHPNP